MEGGNKRVRPGNLSESLVTLTFMGKVSPFMYARREPSVCKCCLDAANVRNVFEMEPDDSAAVKSSSLNPIQRSGESAPRPLSAYAHLYNMRLPAEACVCV